MSLHALLALFAVAVVAATVDAIAGGGGLLTVPALLLAGLDPVAAVATNKVQSSVGAVSATAVFVHRRLVRWPLAWSFVAAGAGAAAIGARAIDWVPRSLLAALVPLVLIAVAVYFACARPPRESGRDARLSPLVFAAFYVSAIGFYDGIFGPGTGSFLTIGFVALLGYGIIEATAHTKLANAASNIGALAVFAVTGKVVWPVGLAMAAGAALGGQIGSRLTLRHGGAVVRPLLIAISCCLALKLLADPTNPLRQALSRALPGAWP